MDEPRLPCWCKAGKNLLKTGSCTDIKLIELRTNQALNGIVKVTYKCLTTQVYFILIGSC